MKTLAKEFGALSVTKAGPIYTINADVFGWEQINPTQQFFVARTYFDLAGLTIDDKTLFFEAAGVQDVSNIAAVIDILSNKPLTNTEALNAIVSGNMVSTASANLTFDQTIYMRYRIFNTDLDNVAGGYMITLTDNQLGSMSPTASDRVYVTRIVSIAGGDASYDIQPVRYVLRASAKEEPEFEYLMRLKRSYDLQQQFDRD
jgi:hypothetical protein